MNTCLLESDESQTLSEGHNYIMKLHKQVEINSPNYDKNSLQNKIGTE